MADELGDVHGSSRVVAVEHLLDGRPVDRDEPPLAARPASPFGIARVSVEAGVHLDERVAVGRIREWCVAQPVDPDQLRGHALAHLGRVIRVGEDHQPGVRVEIDEPGRDDLAPRIDRASSIDRGVVAGCRQPDSIAGDRQLAAPCRRSGPVDDGGAADQEVDLLLVHGAPRRDPLHAQRAVAGQAVEEVEQPQERAGDEAQPAEVDRLLEADLVPAEHGRDRRQLGHVLGPEVAGHRAPDAANGGWRDP